MDASYYFPIFIGVTSIVTFLYGSVFLSSGDYKLQEKGNPHILIPLLCCITCIYFLGNRPISNVFGDTVSYAHSYNILDHIDNRIVRMDWSSEWVWDWITNTCHKMGLSASGYFTAIEAGYFLSILFAVRILMPNNVFLGILFVFSSFSFFTFGVNGMRNGLAAHIILLGFAFYLYGAKIISYILFIIAFGIHRSVALPIASFFVAIYVIKDTKNAIYIWIVSIFISLASGNYFTNLFSGLGFDDRMGQYMNVEGGNVLENSTSAFRWDFLLYSSMPIVLAWIICVKEAVTDTWYNILVKTYCFSNAFWVLVIRASFTNRFAYLSWFLYPILIAYPLIMLPIWNDQDNKTGIILYLYVFLTLGICYFTGVL